MAFGLYDAVVVVDNPHGPPYNGMRGFIEQFYDVAGDMNINLEFAG